MKNENRADSSLVGKGTLSNRHSLWEVLVTFHHKIDIITSKFIIFFNESFKDNMSTNYISMSREWLTFLPELIFILMIII